MVPEQTRNRFLAGTTLAGGSALAGVLGPVGYLPGRAVEWRTNAIDTPDGLPAPIEPTEGHVAAARGDARALVDRYGDDPTARILLADVRGNVESASIGYPDRELAYPHAEGYAWYRFAFGQCVHFEDVLETALPRATGDSDRTPVPPNGRGGDGERRDGDQGSNGAAAGSGLRPRRGRPRRSGSGRRRRRA